MVARPAVLASIVALTLAGCSGDEVAERGCTEGASGPGGVVGFDVDSGEQRWALPVGRPDGAAVVGDVAVVSSEHVVRGVATETGEIVWCVELEAGNGDLPGALAAAGPIVGALAVGAVVGLDAETGAERWRRPLGAFDAQLRGGEVLRVFDVSDDGTPIMVLDPTTGQDVTDVDPLVSDVKWFGVGAAPTAVDGLELSTADGPWDEQTIALSVTRDGSVVWEETVPGFVAALVRGANGPVVVVLDQTGGTGEPPVVPEFVETTVAGYAAMSGEVLWQHPLPETPHLIAQVSDDVIAVPVGTDVHAISVSTGAESWVAGLESAGQGGSYDHPGAFWFIGTGTSDTAVAVGSAEQPYRD
jgi:outer membrane protein assembly factor BamB